MLRIACSILLGLLLVSANALAAGPFQNAAPQIRGEARANPAPWRPAFGAINPQAMDTQQPTDNDPASNARAIPPSVSQSRDNSHDADISQTQPRDAATSPPAAHLAQRPEDGPGITQVTQRMDKLPNSAGQVWREYDITPYTSQITHGDQPQQAIVDWILRETGTEMWFHQPLGILSATGNQLYVYHTPEIQNVVRRMVDRFVRTRGQLQKLDVTLLTVENPNWRASSYTMLQPIDVRAAGVEAFMISKENAALLQGQLSRRVDAKTVNAGTMTSHDGQSLLLERYRPVQFVSSLRWVPNQTPNYQPLMTNLQEGYRLSISCLSTLDNQTIEAVIKCDVDQVEKLSNVKVSVPGLNGAAEQMNLQIPQLISWRLHERFKWPNDQVLLLSCGVVATPDPSQAAGPLAGLTGGKLPLLGLNSNAKRADALLFIEYRGPATEASLPRSADSGLAPLRPR